MKPNARGEPPPTAGAQRTLLAVGSTAKLGAARHARHRRRARIPAYGLYGLSL